VGVASSAITEIGGEVAKRLDDGMMAVFGHPATQENGAPALEDIDGLYGD